MFGLNHEETKMIFVECIFTLCSVMASVFTNVYLYSFTGSLVVMAIYTVFRMMMFTPFFTLAGKIAGKCRFSYTLSIGLIVLAIQLGVVLGFHDYFGVYPWLIYIVAMILGIGESFFWCSVNSLNQIVSSDESRATFLSCFGIFDNIANILAPVLSGIIIATSSTDTEGYLTIFKIVLVVYVILAFIAFQVKADVKKEDFHVLKCLKLSSSDVREKKWKTNSISTIFFGIHNSLSLMLSGLLIYNATGGSGSIYSSLLAVFALLSIISYAIAGKVLRKKSVLNCFVVSSIVMASSAIVLVLVPNIWGAIYYGISNYIGIAFYSNTYSLLGMRAIALFEEEENITGRVIARETYLAIGRCTGMLMIVVASFILPEQYYLICSVMGISLFAIVASVFAKISYGKIEEVKQ